MARHSDVERPAGMANLPVCPVASLSARSGERQGSGVAATPVRLGASVHRLHADVVQRLLEL
ncbi:MAG: hypothetical protein ACREEV_06715, partial [Dongiaceae bacterium]